MFGSENLVKLLPPTVETCQPRLDGLLENTKTMSALSTNAAACGGEWGLFCLS